MNRREIVLGAAALAACGADGQAQPAPPPFPMRRGVNLGNALEAPNEGDWGYRIEDDHLAAIADAGFDGVRLPVRWDVHADSTAPFEIDPRFVDRVRTVIETALARDLYVQLDMHHYDGLNQAPQQHSERARDLWLQVAWEMRDFEDRLIFEPFNEPNGEYWRNATLTEFQRDVIATIKQMRPERTVVVGPGNWQNIDALDDWQPPATANAVSVHYYEPHSFTHENAEWLGADAPQFGREWGTPADHAAVRGHIERAASWGARHGVAMQLGEFGVNRALPVQQRAAWTRTVREACDASGMAWCVWDFAGAFPIWDRDRRAFIPPMLEALGLQ